MKLRTPWTLALSFLLPLLASAAPPPPAAPDYPAIFARARELYQGASPLDRKRTAKAAPESVIVEILQKSPSKLSQSREELLAEVARESASRPDPTKHLRLIPPAGQPGYSELQLYVSHDFNAGRASNLVKVWGDFLSRAKKQIILNVFDFDLMEIAEILVRKARSGVQVRVGIDRGVIAERAEVKAVRDFLVQGGVQVSEVSSVGLNHQKTAAIDWEDPSQARVLFSSGNLTQSCLGPEGDLKDVPAAERPRGSVPNANHVMTMKSWLLATLVQHELTKTLDPRFALRGSEYPTTGSYQVTGPGVPADTLEAYPERSLIITFSPGGGYRSINKNLIAHFIRKSDGPIRMAQFAYSSAAVASALRARAVQASQARRPFDFKSVGDTPFAMQGWSQFLKMSGLELRKAGGKKSFVEDGSNPWVRELPSADLQALRANVRIGPPEFRNSKVRVGGVSRDVSAKIHHKVLVAAPFAILATSFNFSDGAETNNEQILVFRDPDLVRAGTGIVESLFRRSQSSVYDEAQRRNRLGEMDDDREESAGESGGR